MKAQAETFFICIMAAMAEKQLSASEALFGVALKIKEEREMATGCNNRRLRSACLAMSAGIKLAAWRQSLACNSWHQLMAISGESGSSAASGLKISIFESSKLNQLGGGENQRHSGGSKRWRRRHQIAAGGVMASAWRRQSASYRSLAAASETAGVMAKSQPGVAKISW